MSAEYGRAMGGVVNTVTKSGTNDLHGSAFYFLLPFMEQDNYYRVLDINNRPAFWTSPWPASLIETGTASWPDRSTATLTSSTNCRPVSRASATTTAFGSAAS